MDRDRVVEAVATIPRKQRRYIPDAESVFNQSSNSVGTNSRQPSISHYDSVPSRRHPHRVDTTYKKPDYDDVGPWEPQQPQQRQKHLVRQKSNDYVDPKVIRRGKSQEGGLERQYSYDSGSVSGVANCSDPVALKRQHSRDNYVDPQVLRKQQQLRQQQKHQTGNNYSESHTLSRKSHHASREDNYGEPRMVRTLPRQASESLYAESTRSNHYGDARSLRAQQRSSSSRQASLEAALKSSDEHTIEDNIENQRRLSKPELRQFSREPTVIHLHNKTASYNDYPQQMTQEDFKHYHINDNVDHPRGKVLETSINGDKSPLTPPRKSQSSNSPEWPPPPDPITPISPDVPTQTAFDSTTLKRMLRSLPDSRTESGSSEPHQEPTSTSSSPIRGTEPEYSQHIAPKSQMDLSMLPHIQTRPPINPKSQRTTNIEPLETEIPYNIHSHSRMSYPDSGVSGMTNDTTGSVRSGSSNKSKGSHKSATLPPGKIYRKLTSYLSDDLKGYFTMM